MDDYYKILDIQYDASITDITNNFNLLTKKKFMRLLFAVHLLKIN